MFPPPKTFASASKIIILLQFRGFPYLIFRLNRLLRQISLNLRDLYLCGAQWRLVKGGDVEKKNNYQQNRRRRRRTRGSQGAFSSQMQPQINEDVRSLLDLETPEAKSEVTCGKWENRFCRFVHSHQNLILAAFLLFYRLWVRRNCLSPFLRRN